MVLELTDQLLNYPTENEDSVITCITNILIGYYEGNHMLMSSDFFCNSISNKLKDDRAIRALHYLQNHLSFSYNVDWVAKVVLENADVSKHEIEIDFFRTTSAIQPTRVIGENLYDAYFYYYVMCSMIPDSNIIESTAYIPDLGGGSTSIEKMSFLRKSNNSICLGIFDSDKRYPSEINKNSLSSKLKKKYKKAKVSFMVDIINVREVENLIPINYIKKHLKRNGKKSTISFIEKLQKLNNQDYLNHYDIKEGIKYNINENNMDYYVFLRDMYESLNDKNRISFEAYINSKKEKDNPVVQLFPTISRIILKDLVEESGVTSSKIDTYIWDNEIRLKNEWERIAKLMYTFTCSRKKDPIN